MSGAPEFIPAVGGDLLTGKGNQRLFTPWLAAPTLTLTSTALSTTAQRVMVGVALAGSSRV